MNSDDVGAVGMVTKSAVVIAVAVYRLPLLAALSLTSSRVAVGLHEPVFVSARYRSYGTPGSSQWCPDPVVRIGSGAR